MLKANDPHYLISDQYRDAGNLNARIEIHRRFSTNGYGWNRWLFDIIAAAAGPRVLELGCGSASLWIANLARVPASWQITLSDFSPGMVAAAKRGLDGHAGRFRFQVVDAQEIPFDDGSCDTVIANHMLYHVPDPNKALSEIHRVLRPDGRLYTSTVGREHLTELVEWNRRFGLNAISNEDIAERFGLETGAARLAPWFTTVTRHVYEDALIVAEAGPLIAYVLSSMSADQVAAAADQLGAFARFVDDELAAHGSLKITKASGLFEATKESS
ncbi:MAG: class I SAM-dependent methyltransferase [Chloroflexi bacterium]|nr:class I SAM-dependent methyltransferase [Chloroflexota bacterium]